MAMMRNFFIYAPDIHEGDAVGNHCLGLVSVCERLGYHVSIYAQRASTLSQSIKINNASRLIEAVGKDDVLFVSYSIYDELLDDILTLQCKKICYFHDVTPYELLVDYDKTTADLCQRSLLQLSKLDKFDVIISNSTPSSLSLKRHGVKRDVIIIPPVFKDFGLLRHPSKLNRKSEGRDCFNIICVGRVVPHKRIEDIINVFSLLSSSESNEFRLFVIGNMPNYNYNKLLFNYARKLGVLEKISFTGMLSETDLKYQFECADAFLTMSLHEGFCIPVLESMHFGIPVVARSGTAADDLLGTLTHQISTAHEAADAIRLLSRIPQDHERLLSRARAILEQTSDEVWYAAFSAL